MTSRQTVRRLTYLSLEAPRDGQASATHVTEIINELEAQGWHICRQFARHTGVTGKASFLLRLYDYLAVQLRTIAAFPKTDVLYVRAHFMAVLATRIAPLFGVVVVHEVNGRLDDVAITYPGMTRVLGVLRWMQRVQFRSAAHVFAVTDGLADWSRELAGHDRVSLTPNGANITLFTPDGPAHAHDQPYVIFIGSLAPWHGIDTLLASVADPAWPAETALLIIGDGRARDKVVANCDPRICWLGLKPYGEIPTYLRGAIAALVPITSPANRSSAGVAPLKLYEAMACGVPVIVTDLPFQAELVRGSEAGLVVPPGEAHGLALAVATLSADRDLGLRLGSNGRTAALNESWHVRATAIDAVLRGLLADRGRRG
jgi:glycosyltransferase involved in cell wall biosynthesis